MKIEDITSNHTRKEMNEIAIGLGIDDPRTYSNKQDLAKVMLPLIEENNREKTIFEGLKKVNSLLKNIRNTKVPIHVFKEKVRLLTSEEEVTEIEGVEEQIQELLALGGIISEINDKLKELEIITDSFYNEEARKDVQENIEFILKKAEEGMYSEALEEVTLAVDNIGNQDVEFKWEEELDIRFEEAKKTISDLRETGAPLDKLKRLFKEGLEYRKRGEREAALEKIKEILRLAEMNSGVYTRLKEGRDLLKVMKDNKLDFRSHLEILKACKELCEEGDHERAIKELDITIKNMKEQLEGTKQDDSYGELLKRVDAMEKELVAIKEELMRMSKG